MELWDAYNADGTLAGIDLIRGNDIPKGLYHAVSEVFVMHKDGTILVMQRSFDKPNSPGLLESGAAGSVVKGESFFDGAVRELKEETGIESRDLKELYHIVAEEVIYQGYLCIVDIDKDSIKLQEGETIGYQWVTKEEFLKILSSDKILRHLKINLKEFISNDFKIIE